MEDRLRECPRCRSNYVRIVHIQLDNTFKPECDNCQTGGPHLHSEQSALKWWNVRATDPLLGKMASYIKMIINLYDFKENDLWMEDGGKLLKKYREATCRQGMR